MKVNEVLYNKLIMLRQLTLLFSKYHQFEKKMLDNFQTDGYGIFKPKSIF